MAGNQPHLNSQAQLAPNIKHPQLSFRKKIRDILTPAERRGAIGLLGLMFVAMGLETLGIGLIIPVLALLTQPNYASKFPVIQRMFEQLGNPSTNRIIVGVMLVLVVTYLVKAVFLSLVAWRQTRFAYGVQADLSQRLFTRYLGQPYVFFLQRNSAQLLHNITGEIGRFAGYMVIPTLTLVSEFLVFAGLAILLLVVEPIGTLIVGGVLGAVGWVFQFFVRGRTRRWGKLRLHHEGLRLQHAQQGLGGAKDVKLLGREAEFLGQFQVHNVQSARMVQLEQTTAALPRLGLELLAVIGLAALVLAMVMQGRTMDFILPTLGVFAAAAFRVLPSITRIISSTQMLNYGMPVLDILHEEFRLPAPSIKTSSPLPQISFQQALELRDLSYCYPNRTAPALDCINLTIRRGEAVGFVGTSGAGKSTLIDVLLGLLAPSGGALLIDGVDIRGAERTWQDQIGYVPQTIYLTDDTLRRNVAFCVPATLINEAAVERAIRAAQLVEFVRGLPSGLNTIVGERGVRLSGGQRQRIGLARALYHDPAVLVLDEATGALDAATENNVMEAVKALQGTKTLIIVAHRLSTVERCDRLYRLENGRVVDQGSYSTVVKGTLKDAKA
jgi:ATP-binding cassette, subfamily B, bacterial PglK